VCRLQNNIDAGADAGHRLAQKFHKKRLRQSMQDHYREAGILSISFGSHTPVDGLLVVDM
jgi:hypothetical protein